MEVMKRKMCATYDMGKVVTQITPEDDFNVPDVKPDIAKILKSTGEVQLDSQQTMDGKLLFSGKLLFKVLYVTGQKENSLACMKGEIPFSESLFLPEGVGADAEIHIDTQIEDLSVGMINSRKLSVNSIITVIANILSSNGEEAVVGIAFDNDVQYMTRQTSFVTLADTHKDIFRIKDEIVLPSNKPNIAELLWSEWQPGTVDCRPMEGRLGIRGELKLFIIYIAGDESGSLQWSEHMMPFAGEIPISECNEALYPYVRCRPVHREIEVKADDDGEQRIMVIDEAVELDIILYEENERELVSDVYSSMVDMEPEQRDVKCLELLGKNSSRCRVSEKVHINDANPQILQICSSNSNVKIDSTAIVEDGILVEGVVEATMLYIALDDKQPFYETIGVIPFSHKIEVPGIDDTCVYNVLGSTEQLSVIMLSSEDVECKISIVLEAIVFRTKNENIIVDIREKPYDTEKIAAMPGIVGYVVQPGDTLWKIAKKFYTTVESIKEINGLTDDMLKVGDKLVIMKKVAGKDVI
ncbi:MAG: DUF3794 domain-containing protein [Lachnospiraceae bacterium]|nr:DUF3794 domain-containing protein [Lachnospiraceae bacterium]